MAEKESLDDAESSKREGLHWRETNKVLFGLGVIVFLGILFGGYKYFDNHTHNDVDARINVVENQLENEITNLENQVLDLANLIVHLGGEMEDMRRCISDFVDSVNALDGSNYLAVPYRDPVKQLKDRSEGNFIDPNCVEVG